MERSMRFWLSYSVPAGKKAGISIMAAAATGLFIGTALGAATYSISQKDREFQPKQISIKRGETLRFINDDGQLLHHAYLKSDSFNFDSGDQKPGSTFEVSFPVAGSFSVLCAIHPKMKLTVDVN